MKYVLIESYSEGSWEPWTYTVVDTSDSKEELEEKANRYNQRREEEDRLAEKAKAFYDLHCNDSTVPNIPEEYKCFFDVWMTQDDYGTEYETFDWKYNRGIIIYKVEEVQKAQYGD